MNGETKYPEVREITRKDRVTLSRLIEVFAEKSGNIKLTEMVPALKGATTEDKPDAVYELIKSVLSGLFAWMEEDVSVWFRDLLGGATREEYDNMPFDIEMYVIDTLCKRGEFTGFFSKAWDLYRRIPG